MTFKFNEAEQAIVNYGVEKAVKRVENVTMDAEERIEIMDGLPPSPAGWSRNFGRSHAGHYALRQILHDITLEVRLIREDDKEKYLRKAKENLPNTESVLSSGGLYHSTAVYDALLKTTEFRKECGLKMLSRDAYLELSDAYISQEAPDLYKRQEELERELYRVFDPFKATMETVICPNIKAAELRSQEQRSK